MSKEFLGAQDVSCVCAGIGVLGLMFIGVSVGVTSTLVVQYLIEKIKIWKSRGKSEVSLKSSVFKTIPTPLCSSCIAKAKSIQKAQLESNMNENDEIKVLRGAISLFESRTERSHEKVVNYLSPHEVRSKLFSADVKSMSLTSDLSNSKTKGYDMVELLRNIQKFSVDTSHPLFFNQLFGATDPIALAAELVALSVNTSAYTFETAPVFTMIERELIQNVGHLVFGQEIEVDGLVLPGGSLSNLTALHVARYYATTNIYPRNAIHQSNDEFRFEEKKIEDEWDKNKQFVAFVSSEAHYSFIKAIKVLGMGAENLIVVPTLENGQMDPNQLDLLMTQNRNRRKPFFVGLTAGSTVRGSFDDITAVVDVCRKHERQMDEECCTIGAVHKVWIHVDGAWGGPAIFSRRPDVRGLLNGIECVDSFTFNPHKMLGAPQQTTIFVARHQGILKIANSTGAKYLFDNRKHGAEYDLGDMSYTCGRRTDAVKAWAMWKYYGICGLAKIVEDKVDILQRLVTHLRHHPDFMLACEPWAFNVNFYFLPNRIRQKLKERGIDMSHNRPLIPHDLAQDLAEISVKLKLRLHKSGEMLIPYQPLTSQEADCFRIVLAGNKKFDEHDIMRLMELMIQYGKDL